MPPANALIAVRKLSTDILLSQWPTNLLIKRDFLKLHGIRATTTRQQVVDMQNVLETQVPILCRNNHSNEESRTSMTGDLPKYLIPTAIIDSHEKTVREYALDMVKGLADPLEMAVKLYLAVRDDILYDPYTPFYLPEHYRASHVLERGRGFCVPKASLLCALGRACSIPSRVGFASVRNHLATRQLIEFMGSDLFAYHGFVEFYLDAKWVKCTPAFNSELCKRHNVPPLEFNGREDSLFQAYSLDNQKFMEYVEYHESYSDIPVDLIVAAWRKTYGEERVNTWIAAFESGKSASLGKFNQEEVVND
jgi:transglutaminase-like putative cysteine protease